MSAFYKQQSFPVLYGKSVHRNVVYTTLGVRARKAFDKLHRKRRGYDIRENWWDNFGWLDGATLDDFRQLANVGPATMIEIASFLRRMGINLDSE